MAWSVAMTVAPSFPSVPSATARTGVGDRAALARVLTARQLAAGARAEAPALVALVRVAGSADVDLAARPDGIAWLDPTTGLLRTVAAGPCPLDQEPACDVPES